MEADETTLVAMTMNGQSISDHLNSVVRNAVTVSVKKNFIPKVEKYLKRVAKTIDSESIGDVHISFHLIQTRSIREWYLMWWLSQQQRC